MLKLDKKSGICYTEYTNAYEYDCHGQLTGEAFTDADGKINITEITYDTAGNIKTKGGKLYEYDSTWKDLLVKYDGKNIYYDALGNPTTYLGNVLTWTVGRKLESFGENISYNYNSLGQRIRKTVGDTEHEYFYEGSRLIKEVRTDTDGTVHTLVFLYDASDSPVGMQYDGTAYYYKKNLQGDVIALLDADCKTIAEYVYDAWGALRTINADTLQNTLIAALNPIRYRGYYYDNETGFYFLQSRYYDPVVGRFINADETAFLGISETVRSYNLFAYCENNPVDNTDSWGYSVGLGVLSTGLAAALKALEALLLIILKAIAICLTIIAILLLLSIANKVMEIVKEAIQKYSEDYNPEGYCVYVLMRSKREFFNIFYVGKTKNYKRRMEQHRDDPRKGELLSCPVIICKNETDMRYWEQIVLSLCIVKEVLVLAGEPGVNRIRGIAKKNLSLLKGTPELDDILSLLTCKREDDLLYLMEQ